VWVLTLVVLTSVACSPGAEEVSTDETTPVAVPDSPAPEAAPEPSPSPERIAATAEEYQQALSVLDDRLAERIKRVAALKGPKGLAERVGDLRDRVDEERATLAAMVPPETIADAHDELDVALSDLSLDLASVESDASSNAVCSGPAALRRTGNGDGAAAVREAVARFAQSDPVEDYVVGTFVPEGGKERNRRGRNGDLRPGKRGGIGEMRITGSPDSDVLIKLRVKKQGIRNVYVRKNSTVKVSRLPDGKYDVYVARGVDWNDKTGRFMRECSFSRLNSPFEFTTTSTQYTIGELELDTLFGNVPSTTLDPEEFPEG
jgi:hypothetical protein